jgi:Ca-activated chloride channel family protein
MMQTDDPRLTAYALGETDAEATREVEAALRDSDALRGEVAQIRAAADRLSAALAAEPPVQLTGEQRQRITAGPARPGRGAWWLAAAATLAAAVPAALFLRSVPPEPFPSAGPTATTTELQMAPSAPPLVENDARPTPAPTPLAAATPAPGRVFSDVLSVAPGPAVQDVVVGGAVANEANSATVSTGPTAAPQPKAGVDMLAGAYVYRRDQGVYGITRADHDRQDFNTESYAHREDSDFVAVAQHPLSTFSVDVDTASYSNVRRFLNERRRPPKDAVRIEEMVNYFPYSYEPPRDGETFAAHVEMAVAPWKREHRLVRIALKAREVQAAARPAANLVFLIDVSGSMRPPNKLPLVRRTLRMLVRRLEPRDRVAMVVYAGNAGLVLPSTSGEQQDVILDAIDRLEAGGSTNGGEGIQLAYDIAAREFIRGGVNRVVLATDGDFNVGTTDEGSLVRLVQEKAKTGVFLTVLGFGMGNLQDSRLEALADKGNGNYAYVDTENEAKKALVDQMNATLVTVAKDVKVQIEFNPARVQAYRLIGYENRALRPEDFKNDEKDAGEVGAGHAVTVLYEIVPPGVAWRPRAVDPLKYQQPGGLTGAARGSELMRLKLRYKQPDGRESEPREWPVADVVRPIEGGSDDVRFAAAVAAFGMILRDSPHKGEATYDLVLRLGEQGRGPDPFGYRAEFLDLVRKSRELR